MATTKKTSSVYDEFEATSTKAIKKIAEKEDQELSQGRNGDRIELVDGVNKIRFFPKRKGEESFYLMRSAHWYTITNDKGEDVRRSVPDAKVHGGMDQDISELYIEFFKERMDSEDADDSKKLKKITSNSYNGGLQPSVTWVAYACVIGKDGKRGKPGEFEFKRSVRDALNSEMIIEDESEAIETDPFTHPKEGRYVLITYNSKAKKSTDYYKTKVSDNKSPLSEEELELLKKMTPLSQLPYFKYTLKDFEIALEGLRNYDEENEINIFEDEEFQEQVKEYKKNLIKTLKDSGVNTEEPTEEADDDLPFEDEEDDTAKRKKSIKKSVDKATTTKNIKKTVEEEEEEEEEEETVTEEEGDEFDSMDRKELIAYKAENELPIKIFKTDSDDDIREKIRGAVAEQEENVEEEPEETEEVEEKPKTEKKTKLTLDDIKKKLKGK